MTSHIHCNNGVVLSTCHFLHHERPVGTKDRAPISPITPISPTPPHPQVTTSSEGFPSTDTLQLGPSSSDPYNNLAICASQEKGRPDAVCAERERRAPTVRKSTARAALPGPPQSHFAIPESCWVRGRVCGRVRTANGRRHRRTCGPAS